MRAAARPVIAAHLSSELKPAPTPGPELVRQMMDFIAGTEIPAGYVDFLSDELALSGDSSKTPDWSEDERRAAGSMKVLVIGAGMSGLLAGIRLSQAGVPFEIVEKNAIIR